MHRKDAGFTLVEMVVVLAVAAILAAIAIPAFDEALTRSRVSTTLHLLSADMAIARHSAIARRDQIVVCPRGSDNRCNPDSDWGMGWLVFLDRDGNRQPDQEGDLLRLHNSTQPTGFRLVSSRPFVRYQTDGRSAGTNLTVHVCKDGTLMGEVVVNNLGRVRSSRPTQDFPCPR